MKEKAKYLAELIRKYALERDPENGPFWENVLFMCEQGLINDGEAELLLIRAKQDIEKARDHPNYLHRTPTKEELNPTGPPDIRIGALTEEPEVEVGVRFDGPFFAVVAGATGRGKTTCIRTFCRRVNEHNRRHPEKPVLLVILDRKGGDYRDFGEDLGFRCLSVHSTFRLSLEPPNGVQPRIWINLVADAFCARGGLKASWTTLVHAIQWLLAVLNPEGKEPLVWPTFGLLLEVLTKLPQETFSTKAEYTQSLIQVLTAVVLSSGTVFDAARGFQIERDVLQARQSVVIHCHNLSPDWCLQFLADVLLQQELARATALQLRPACPRILYIVDEGDADVSAEADESFTDMSTWSRLFKRGREFGIGAAVSVSSTRNLSNLIQENCTGLWVFGLEPVAVAHAAHCLGLPSGGHLRFGWLKKGECIVRLDGPWPHAMVCAVDHTPPSRAVDTAYDSHFFVPGKRLAELPHVQAAVAALAREVLEGKRRRKAQETTAEQPRGLSELAHQFLSFAYEHPYMPVVRMFEAMGRPSAREQNKVRKELEADDLASFDKVRIGKTEILLIELTDEAYRLLRRQPLSKPGRGDLVHRTICNWISMALAKSGLSPVLEWTVPGSRHPVDVAAQVNGKWEVYEVANTTTENLPDSVRACLRSNVVSKVTVVFTEKTKRDQHRAEILSALSGEARIGDVEFTTADRYYKEI